MNRSAANSIYEIKRTISNWRIFPLSNSKFPAAEIGRVQIGLSISSQHRAEKDLNKLRLIQILSFNYRSETTCIGPMRESPRT